MASSGRVCRCGRSMSSTRVAADAATGGSCSLCHHGLAGAYVFLYCAHCNVTDRTHTVCPSAVPPPPLHATGYGYPPPPYYFPPGVYPPPYLPPPPQEERRRWRGRSWLDSFKHGAANEGGRNSADLAFYYGQSYYMDHRQNNDQYHNSNLQQASGDDDDFDIE